MQDTSNLESLDNNSLIKRITDLRLSLVSVANEYTLALLEEVERRFGGGGPLTPIEQLPKKEQELRKTYESLKAHSLRPERKNAAHPGLGRHLEPYHEWRTDYLKREIESRKASRAETQHLNETFQSRVERYLKKHNNSIIIPPNNEITDRARDVAAYEIDILKNNNTSKELLYKVIQITNFKDPTLPDRIKYWVVTRNDYEKMKEHREERKSSKGKG